MDKLNLIQSLRCELAELSEQKEINAEKLKELDKLYENNDDQLKELMVELYDIKEEFYDKITKKYMLLTCPVGIVCASIVFFVWNHNFVSRGLSDYVISTGVSGLILVTFLASSYFFSMNSNLDKFIVKIFPKLQIYCDKISLLKNNIAKKREETQDIIAQQNTLNFSNHSIGEIIERKKQELDRLTDDYFDNIENNHVTEEKETRGKTRVRTPKNK